MAYKDIVNRYILIYYSQNLDYKEKGLYVFSIRSSEQPSVRSSVLTSKKTNRQGLYASICIGQVDQKRAQEIAEDVRMHLAVYTYWHLNTKCTLCNVATYSNNEFFTSNIDLVVDYIEQTFKKEEK